MLTWLAVAIGGALGSLARHGVNVVTTRLMGTVGPYGTALVNITGCAVIGLLAGRIATGDWRVGVAMRAFVFVGVLGGFTTFSSFGLDTFSLAHGGHRLAAAVNVAAQVVTGLAAVFGGYWLSARF